MKPGDVNMPLIDATHRRNPNRLKTESIDWRALETGPDFVSSVNVELTGPVITVSLSNYATIGRCVELLVRKIKLVFNPFLKSFYEKAVVEHCKGGADRMENLIKLFGCLSLLHDQFHMVDLPTPARILAQSGFCVKTFKISDALELVEMNVSPAVVISNFDTWKRFHKPEDRELWGFRDRICAEFAKEFFTHLDKLLSKQKTNSDIKTILKVNKQVRMLIEEVKRYQSRSLLNALDRELERFRESKRNTSNPLCKYTKSALFAILGGNSRTYEVSGKLIDFYFEKLKELVTGKDAREVIGILEVEIRELLK